MKKIFVAVAAVMLLSSITPVFSMDFIVGAKAGYFIWDPYTKRMGISQFEDMANGTGILYGPIFSLLFTQELSLSISGLFGSQNTKGITFDAAQGTSNLATTKFTFDTFRIDIDGALSYRISEYFRVFAGYKFWYLRTRYNAITLETNTALQLTKVEETTLYIVQPFHGPALGAGFSLPLGSRGYFVAGNFSVIYMWGLFQFQPRSGFSYNTTAGSPFRGPAGNMLRSTINMILVGINIEPMVGINLGEGLPIVTLGFRYQWNRYKFMDLTDEERNQLHFTNNWMDDHLYGVFVSVMYAF